jgi:hypothetical protein
MQKSRKRGDQPATMSSVIRRQWLAQFFAAAPIPTIIDAVTGEPWLLITDHYRVKDWTALQRALAAQPDVDGDRERGWSRLVKGTDDQLRPIASVNPDRDPGRISVFYRTQRHADQGRPWFEGLSGRAVQFVARELADPKGVLANASLTETTKPRRAPDLPSEVMAEVLEKAIRQTYANWADEPIPALGGKTPRQAIQRPAGLERVKGLLRGYEARENEQARRQRRPAISYAFLWETLGIAR